MERRVQHAVGRRAPALTAVIVSMALLVAACSDDDATTGTSGATEATNSSRDDPLAAANARVADAEDGVTEANDALVAAHSDFCGAAEGYVETLDRYGHVFTDRSAAVGDVQTLGADLIEPGDEVVSTVDAVESTKRDLATAQQELADAQAELAAAVATASSVPIDTTSPTTSTTTTLVAPATIERVQQAEEDLARAERGITAETPLVEAGAEYNSAALALEVAWLRLLDEAQCFTDEQQATAVEQLAAYTTALQTDLTTAGYDPGAIDGIYGPKTVAAVEQLQTDSDLPVTGLVDEATNRALQDELEAVGQQQATHVVALQTILTLTGFWDGEIDGQWTDELTQALMDFQTALGVEPTGAVDAPTLAAFQQTLADLQAFLASGPTTTVATAPPTTTAATDAPSSTEATVVVADSAPGA